MSVRLELPPDVYVPLFLSVVPPLLSRILVLLRLLLLLFLPLDVVGVGVICNEVLLAPMVGVLVTSQLEAPSEVRAYD